MRGKKRVIKVGNVPVKSREQIEGIRESGKINTMVLDYVKNISKQVSPPRRSMTGYGK